MNIINALFPEDCPKDIFEKNRYFFNPKFFDALYDTDEDLFKDIFDSPRRRKGE